MSVKSFFDSVFGRRNLAKLVQKDHKIKLKHHEFDEFFEAQIQSIGSEQIKVAIDDVFERDKFCTNDHIVVSFVKSNEVFWADGEILNVKHGLFVEMLLKLKDVKKRENMRKKSRYFVSLSGSMKNEAEDVGRAVVVRDLSFRGLRVDCSSEFEVDSIVYISINLSKHQKCSFKGRVVRRCEVGKGFEYGIEICNIMRENNIVLYDYINKLENAV